MQLDEKNKQKKKKISLEHKQDISSTVILRYV